MKLICKKEHKYKGKTHLIIGNVYECIECNHFYYKHSIKTETGDNMGLTEDKRHYYIWDYFIHPSEWRDKRIDEILEDD